jgi:ABC-type spermidine/putrescine transport system permease subunit II
VNGNAALAIILVLSIVVPLVILGVVCWIFLQAARRDAGRR